MNEEGGLTIRSFRVVFDLERRLFKIDRWRLPVPYGVPLRGIAYAFFVLLAVLMLARLPVVGEALALLPPPVRFVILPIGVAYLFNELRIDGRSAHTAAVAWVRFRLAPARAVAFRRAISAGSGARFAPITFVPDERSARYRPARLKGPARILLRYPAAAERRGATLRMEQTSDRPMWWGKRIVLKPQQEVLFR